MSRHRAAGPPQAEATGDRWLLADPFRLCFLMEGLTPITPGELLDADFLQPLGVSQYRLAKAIDVPASRISEIVGGGGAPSAPIPI